MTNTRGEPTQLGDGETRFGAGTFYGLPNRGVALPSWESRTRLKPLLADGSFSVSDGGVLPDGWEVVSPNSALAPDFRATLGEDGKWALQASGSGRRETYGYVRRRVRLESGSAYCLRVVLRTDRMDDLNRHLVHGVFASGFNNGVFSYRLVGERVVGENRFAGPEQSVDAEVRLYFRYCANGRVIWESVSLDEVAPIPVRLVTVAVTWGYGDLPHWSRWLDKAGKRGADIALLPEFFNTTDTNAAEPIDGPASSLLAAKAREHQMHVCGTFCEQYGDMRFNSAPLYDRDGRLLGVYRKNELYDPEADIGETPGAGYPVFRTDVGNVGIVTCYDSWFPEPMRLLAYKGAEIVLLPNAGYFMGLMPARASDNGLWIAVSSLNCPAGVWDSSGAMAGDEHDDPTRYAPTSITAVERDDTNRFLLVTFDLSRRYSPHWWGGPMLSAPGGRRCRQTLVEPIEDAIAAESRRWWTTV